MSSGEAVGSPTSVARYAKPGDWITAVEAQPQWVREQGSALLAQRGARPERPCE